MIARLRGTLAEKHPGRITVDVAGVGYDVAIPISTFASLAGEGEPVTLYIHTNVREDAIALFGFLTLAEKALFEKLIGVSGIGPSLAVKVLSGLQAEDLVRAIRGGMVEQLVRIPGVGKKTAERMVLELKDKLELVGAAAAASAPAVKLDPVESDVMSALINLGLAAPLAEQALKKAKAQAGTGDFEALFRKALEMAR